MTFQSTLSVRRATSTTTNTHMEIPLFQSTLSVRRATGVNLHDTDFLCWISIHALREESDDKFGGDKSDAFIISIHALREESDARLLKKPIAFLIPFQSTLSVRRATVNTGVSTVASNHFNPRSP